MTDQCTLEYVAVRVGDSRDYDIGREVAGLNSSVDIDRLDQTACNRQSNVFGPAGVKKGFLGVDRRHLATYRTVKQPPSLCYRTPDSSVVKEHV